VDLGRSEELFKISDSRDALGQIAGHPCGVRGEKRCQTAKFGVSELAPFHAFSLTGGGESQYVVVVLSGHEARTSHAK
jgi:hypothetical protein